MPKFHSPVSRVRDWRANLVEVAEARLQQLESQENEMKTAVANLDATIAEVTRATHESVGLAGKDLKALADHRSHMLRRRSVILKNYLSLSAQVSTQRELTIRLRRDHKLVESLLEVHRKKWELEYDHKQEVIAADLYLAIRQSLKQVEDHADSADGPAEHS